MSKASIRLDNIKARLVTMPLVIAHGLRVALIATEEYDEIINAAAGKQLDGKCIYLIKSGAENPDTEVIDRAHYEMSFVVEIWSDTAKHNSDSPDHDDIEEEIIAHLHGWVSGDVNNATAHVQRCVFIDADYLGDILGDQGETEFLRYGLTFKTRLSIPLID